MPEVAGLCLVLHLGVGQGCGAVRAPVDDPAALVDEALAVKVHEHPAHRVGAALVHGEAGTAPVAGGAQLFLLLHNAAAVLFLPVPHPLQKGLAAQVMAAHALGAQGLLHLNLGGDAGVVGAGHPKRGVPLHPLEAGEHVLKRAVHGMSHVELPGDVGRRHYNGKGLLIRVSVTLKAAAALPHFINSALGLSGLVDLRQLLLHISSSPHQNSKKAPSLSAQGERSVRGTT
ncbi:hypothetical protein SDC9_113693 [bioreactor metagenome]|uniref:Uncharacterized protein n=1 Tax=bioreactor metagenome TaxID=1076179 RepID=A0A645BNN3_9ZZZZ